VIPVLPSDGVWYSRPNSALDPITNELAFPSGPGLAYGSDLVDDGPQEFAAGSVLSVEFAGGLKLWNGAAFVDAGATEIKAFRGQNVNISMPPENYAVTTDMGPFDSLSLPTVTAGYVPQVANAHSSVRFALLGDGTSPTSNSPDGAYLLSMKITSTEAGLDPSDAYHFVLHKNASAADVSAAVASLPFAPEFVQYVPEPSSLALAAVAVAAHSVRRRTRTSPREGSCHA
jgi:hypothetical protein